MQLWRGRLAASRPLLWALMLAIPFPYIANTAGWTVAELGRQPWIIAPAFSLTATQAATGQHGLRVALIWWTLGISFAVGYAAFVYRAARGRVRVDGP